MKALGKILEIWFGRVQGVLRLLGHQKMQSCQVMADDRYLTRPFHTASTSPISSFGAFLRFLDNSFALLLLLLFLLSIDLSSPPVSSPQLGASVGAVKNSRSRKWNVEIHQAPNPKIQDCQPAPRVGRGEPVESAWSRGGQFDGMAKHTEQ